VQIEKRLLTCWTKETLVDFFAAQDLARRKTKWLVFYYALAILFMVVGIYLVVMIVLNMASKSQTPQIFNPLILAAVTVGNLLVIGFSSMSKLSELRAGGQHVASLMGGVRVPPQTTDATERRLLNVVEEMALAAGVSVPPVYIMNDEPGINAFAAGYSPADAVIAVNRGTVEQLNRDELQGVVAHEFSHILNGDMRINIRLIGILFGIQVLAMIGYFLLRSAGSGRRYSSNNDNKGGAMAILVLGLGILVFGSIGQLFARLIKASISRQREYLADASAVQFTRYPDGIAGALKMIGASSQGSVVRSSEAESLSHMFFASCFGSQMAGLFATHPPLVERIQRVDAQFDGDFNKYVARRQELARMHAQREAKKRQDRDKREKDLGGFFQGIFPAEIAARFSIDPAILIAAIGAPNSDDVHYSKSLIQQIPQPIVEATRAAFSARCVAFATLLDQSESLRNEQLKLIARFEGLPSAETTLKLWPLVNQLDLALRLPMMEMIQSSLSDLSPQQYQRFRGTIEALINIDRQVTLFEFVVSHHLLMHLDRRFTNPKPARIVYSQVKQLQNEFELLLSAFASVGDVEAPVAQAAYELAMQTAGLTGTSASLHAWEIKQLDASLSKLEISTLDVKRQFLQAAAVLITYDHEITVAEAELFRAIAESLDCPVPAFVAGKTA
jgi:Zn-dependent protease with chaperone function